MSRRNVRYLQALSFVADVRITGKATRTFSLTEQCPQAQSTVKHRVQGFHAPSVERRFPPCSPGTTYDGSRHAMTVPGTASTSPAHVRATTIPRRTASTRWHLAWRSGGKRSVWRSHAGRRRSRDSLRGRTARSSALCPATGEHRSPMNAFLDWTRQSDSLSFRGEYGRLVRYCAVALSMWDRRRVGAS